LFTGQDTSELDDSSCFSLTLDDAVQKLIIHNKDVQKAKLEYLVGVKQFHAAFGVFEPYLTENHDYSETQHPNSLLIERLEQQKSGIEGVLSTGTHYDFSFIQKDIRFPQNSLDWPDVQFTFSVTQPLLKDFLGNGPLSDIKIAKVDRQIAYNRYRSTLIAQCYDLENAYWKLVYLQEKRRNAEKSVAIAHQIVNDSRTLVASGMISKLDTVEVSSKWAQRQMTLNSVKMEHMGVMNELMQMIGYSPDSAVMHPKAITPLQTDPEKQMPDSLSLKVIDSLLSVNQPELLAAEYTKIRSQIVVSQQRGKSLPELNLTGIMGVSGTNKNSYDLASEQFLDADRNKHNWACSVELKVPLGAGIRERNLLKAEKLNKKIAEIESKSLRNELTTQSVLTLDKMRDLVHNLTNAAIVVNYNSSLLQSELVRLRAGLSNVRKIFDMEQELANARESELELRVQFQMTLSLYDRLLGVTLTKRGLETIVKGKPVLIDKLSRE